MHLRTNQSKTSSIGMSSVPQTSYLDASSFACLSYSVHSESELVVLDDGGETTVVVAFGGKCRGPSSSTSIGVACVVFFFFFCDFDLLGTVLSVELLGAVETS